VLPPTGATEVPEIGRLRTAVAGSYPRRPGTRRRQDGYCLPRRRPQAPPQGGRDKGNGVYGKHQLIRIYLLTGETDKALDPLAELLKVPYWLTPQYVRIDPTFALLKGNPRFEAILKASDSH
jgi:hypothetical protein